MIQAMDSTTNGLWVCVCHLLYRSMYRLAGRPVYRRYVRSS
jgi:hypothetical protein